MLKKIFYICVIIAIFVGINADSIKNFGKTVPEFSDLTESFSWARPSVTFLAEMGAVSGTEDGLFSPQKSVSKEQFAKMLCLSFSLKTPKTSVTTFLDVSPDRWSHPYIEATSEYFLSNSDFGVNEFRPDSEITRTDVACTISKILGLKADNRKAIDEKYTDCSFIDDTEAYYLAAAEKAEIIKGSDGFLRPYDAITRAEAAVILKRAIDYKENGTQSLSKESGKTPILGKSEIEKSKAKRWAKEKGADERFINICDLYWEYGERTGIRPEVLYAQAAKETNYGKYTGNVVPEQNNWAGIKTVMASGDKTYDHETFSSPDDGVRGHFNHMCAYTGLAPIGEPHERYKSTVTASWAGTVKFVEDLGGKWAPDENYGKSIVNDYLKSMQDA